MPEHYFQRYAENERGAVLGRLAGKFKQVFAEHAKDGQLHHGATIVRIRRAAADAVAEYGDALVTKLGQYPIDHSPIRKSDFDAARESLELMVERAKAACFEELEILESAMPDGVCSEDFVAPDENAQRVLLDIEGLQLRFESERSFVKWAWGDLQKRLWAASLLAVGGLATYGVQRFWEFVGSS